MHLRRTGLEKLLAITKPENTVSQKLLEALGFHFVETTRLTNDAPEDNLYAMDLT